MSFWDRFRKRGKRKEKQEEDLPEELQASGDDSSSEGGPEDGEMAGSVRLSKEELAREDVVPVDEAEQKRFIRDCREAIAESDRQIEIAKQEYGQVTEYLADIQKIDRMEGERRQRLLELCRSIQRLTQERLRYKNRKAVLSERQIRRFDQFQDELIDGIKKMYQNEMYQKAIENDMKHLETEKAYIRNLQKEIMQKQKSLRGIAKSLTALIISAVLLLALLYFYLDVDMTYPYLGTLFLAAVSATAIFMESHKNRYDIALSDRKLNRAVELLNRTKIKYINNVSVLDYDREKFGVKNARDFEELWGEYCTEKEYGRRFRESTGLLNQNNEDLLALLKKAGLADPDVWLSQVYAILDDREMVEIRHGLNLRRKSLRGRIQYNRETKEDYMARINQILRQNPSLQI